MAALRPTCGVRQPWPQGFTWLQQLGQRRLFVFCIPAPDDGASGDPDLHVRTLGAVPPGASAGGARRPSVMQLLPEGGQRVQAGIHDCPDVAASPAIAARGSACEALLVAGLCDRLQGTQQGGFCLSSAQAKAVVQPRCVRFPLGVSCCQIGWVQGLQVGKHHQEHAAHREEQTSPS